MASKGFADAALLPCTYGLEGVYANEFGVHYANYNVDMRQGNTALRGDVGLNCMHADSGTEENSDCPTAPTTLHALQDHPVMFEATGSREERYILQV